MIELTVKTLDSQNHAFSVPDDTTVKQLKERIAESISFPVESQRLIYCGRVLQDEKNLSEYDVNGKVIHLVQRPPPQATRGNGGQPRSSSNQQGRRGAHPFRQPRLDGNAMYLGAMAFPADLMDAQGIQAPPSSQSLSDSRLLLARRMLRRATVVLNRLENPTASETSDPDTPPDEQHEAGSSAAAAAAAAAGAADAAAQAASAASAAASAASAAASAILGSASGSAGTAGRADGGDAVVLQEGLPHEFEEVLHQGLPLAHAAQAATAAAFAAAVSAAQAAGVPNITILRSGQAGPDLVDVRMEGDDDGAVGPEPSASQGASAQSGGAERRSQDVAGASGGSSDSARSSPPANGHANAVNDEVPRTTVLADLLDELNRVNTRLQPFMQQYHVLMREYPHPENNTTSQDSQRVFSSVSEVMHFLSHAYHALSDIMCDFSQPPPRALRCRPVLIQHSAFLQAGIPIQAQINVMTNRNNPNNNNNISTNNNGANTPVSSAQGTPPAATPAAAAAAATATATAATATAPTVAVEPAVAAPEAAPSAASSAASSAAPNAAPNAAPSAAPSTTPPDNATPPGNQEEGRNRGDARESQEPAFNITPGNVEFFMEVGPGSITIDSLEATVVTNSGGMGGEGIQANVVGGSFPWGAPPPPEFIQNLMQAVAVHMIGRGGTTPNSTTTNQGGSGASTGAATSGQNSQARGNTATHPTTATQTRSTSRPHVHLAPATMQGLGSSSFDPFLPCNSHHIRSRTRQNAQSLTQQFAAAMAGADAAGPSNEQEPAATATTTATSEASAASQQSQPSTQSSASATQQGSGQGAPQAQAHAAGSSQQAPAQQNTHSQSTANAQASSQGNAQGQPQSVTGILNMLSNIFGNMPAGGTAATVNLSNLFQPMMGQQRGGSQASGAQSGGSQASGGTSAGPSPFPPGMAFFNLGGPRFMNHPPRQQQQQQQQPQQQQQQPPPPPPPPPQQPPPPPPQQPQPQPQQQQQQQSQQQSQQQPQSESSFFQRSGSQSQSFNNPMLSQLFQNMSNIMGSDLFNMVNMDGNLADMLMTDGQHGYRPGTSLIMDFVMTMGRHMNFGDIINLTFGNGECLNRTRPHMRQFLIENVFENQPVTPESRARVVERIIQEIRPHLQIMLQGRLREDVDLVTTTTRYNQIRLPELITLIVEGNEVNFGQNMIRWLSRYLREISAIVLHCCLDGEQGLDRILRGYVVEVTRGIHPALQVWTTDSFVTHMQNYVRRQNVPFDEIREYLVYRVPPVQTDSTAQQRSFSSSAPTSMKTDHSPTPTPEPMETDASPDEATASAAGAASGGGMQEESSPPERDSATPTADGPTGAVASDAPERSEGNAAREREVLPPKREPPQSPLPSLTVDGEPLPDVVLGSEAWHNVLPSEWVPIIARDSQRQRRQNPQAPFSDAYLSGMPSKRRKVVASTKPQGNLNQIITESMRSALDEAGVRPVAGVETAGDDLELQAAYREQVRAAVHDSLGANPDFTPDRFPNASKYFAK